MRNARFNSLALLDIQSFPLEGECLDRLALWLGQFDEQRVTLCVSPSASLCDTITSVDEWCIKTLSANPTNPLGLLLPAEQIRERYISPLKTSEKGYKTLRMKMNKSGRYAMQCYSPEKEQIPPPETWRGCFVQPRIVFKGLWIMGREFGAILEISVVLIQGKLLV